MTPLSFDQCLEIDSMSVLMTLTDRGIFKKIRVIPPQIPDEDIIYELLFSALLGVGKDMENMTSLKRMESLLVHAVCFLAIITHKIDNIPPKIVNLIPENVRYGQAYRWVN